MTTATLAATLCFVLASPATPAAGLVEALGDHDPDVRALAAGLLADELVEASPGAEAALLDRAAARDEAWRVRVASVRALAARAASSETALESLVAVALDPEDDWRVRAAVVRSLRRLDGGRYLTRELRDRPEAAEISNGSTTVSLTAPLEDTRILLALGDDDPRMRALAREAVEIGATLALPPRSAAVQSGEARCLVEAFLRVLGPSATAAGVLASY